MKGYLPKIEPLDMLWGAQAVLMSPLWVPLTLLGSLMWTLYTFVPPILSEYAWRLLEWLQRFTVLAMYLSQPAEWSGRRIYGTDMDEFPEEVVGLLAEPLEVGEAMEPESGTDYENDSIG